MLSALLHSCNELFTNLVVVRYMGSCCVMRTRPKVSPNSSSFIESGVVPLEHGHGSSAVVVTGAIHHPKTPRLSLSKRYVVMHEIRDQRRRVVNTCLHNHGFSFHRLTVEVVDAILGHAIHPMLRACNAKALRRPHVTMADSACPGFSTRHGTCMGQQCGDILRLYILALAATEGVADGIVVSRGTVHVAKVHREDHLLWNTASCTEVTSHITSLHISPTRRRLCVGTALIIIQNAMMECIDDRSAVHDGCLSPFIHEVHERASPKAALGTQRRLPTTASHTHVSTYIDPRYMQGIISPQLTNCKPSFYIRIERPDGSVAELCTSSIRHTVLYVPRHSRCYVKGGAGNVIKPLVLYFSHVFGNEP
jgi:hypothetical protein